MPSFRATWAFASAVFVAGSPACARTPADADTPTTPPPSSPAAPAADATTTTTPPAAQEAAPPTSAEPASATAEQPPVVDEVTRAQIGIAEVEGLTIKNAATMFLAQRGKCAADVAALVERGFLARANMDPWGGEYRLECGADGETMKVHSNGPDGRRDTADDVHIE